VLLRPCDTPAGLPTSWEFSGTGPGAVRLTPAAAAAAAAAANASLCMDYGTAAPQLSCASDPLRLLPFCNSSLPPAVRARDLVARMTVFELKKNAVSPPAGVQRLGVPRFGMGEALHGVVTNCGEPHDGNTGCATSFPHALMMAASFNRSLWGAVGEAIGVEGRAFWNQGGAAEPNSLGALK
jgi:beta-D-xylosidase 4